MKKLLLYILLGVLLGLISCRSDVGKVGLRQADSLMTARPDSALSLLEHISPDKLISAYERAEYALLLTQARYKNYVTLTSDSLILQAVNYFKGTDDKVREAKSYFYLGCTYREMHKTVLAADAFLKALRILHKTGIENQILVMTYDHLASCYEKQDFYDKAIDLYKQSYSMRMAMGDSIKTFYPLQGIAHLFLLKERPDSALFYYDQSLKMAHERGDSSWVSTTYCDIARVYNVQKRFEDASQLISKSIACMSADDDPTFNYYLKGEILYNLHQLDSARHYLKLGKESGNLRIRTASYDQLYQLEKKVGNLPISIVYADSFIVLYDSVHVLIKRSEMDKAMDNHELELHKQRLAAEKQSHNHLLGGLFILSFFVVILLFLFADKRRKRKYIDLQSKLMKNRADTMVLQEDMDKMTEGGVRQRNEQWVRLRAEQFQLCKQLFRSSVYYDRLKTIEVSADKLDKYWEAEEREKFYEMLRQTFADVILELKTQCKELTQEDLLYCILLLLGYSKHTICFCMAISANAFKMRKSRLKAKMGEELFDFIFSANHSFYSLPPKGVVKGIYK